jgi:hypothetical protein
MRTQELNDKISLNYGENFALQNSLERANRTPQKKKKASARSVFAKTLEALAPTVFARTNGFQRRSLWRLSSATSWGAPRSGIKKQSAQRAPQVCSMSVWLRR